MAEARTFDLQVEDIDMVISNVATIGEMMNKIDWTVNIMGYISQNNLAVGAAIQKALESFGELSDTTKKSKETVEEIYNDLTTFRARQDENDTEFFM